VRLEGTKGLEEILPQNYPAIGPLGPPKGVTPSAAARGIQTLPDSALANANANPGGTSELMVHPGEERVQERPTPAMRWPLRHPTARLFQPRGRKKGEKRVVSKCHTEDWLKPHGLVEAKLGQPSL